METIKKHHELAMKKRALDAQAEAGRPPRTVKHLKKGKMPPLNPVSPKHSRNQSAFRTPLPNSLRGGRDSHDVSPSQGNMMLDDRFRDRHKSLNADSRLKKKLGFTTNKKGADDVDSKMLDSNATTQQ